MGPQLELAVGAAGEPAVDASVVSECRVRVCQGSGSTQAGSGGTAEPEGSAGPALLVAGTTGSHLARHYMRLVQAYMGPIK